MFTSQRRGHTFSHAGLVSTLVLLHIGQESLDDHLTSLDLSCSSPAAVGAQTLWWPLALALFLTWDSGSHLGHLCPRGHLALCEASLGVTGGSGTLLNVP